MKSTLLRRTLLIVLALSLPIAALANLLNQTKTLAANTALSLDTGATSASGGDFTWNGSSITFQGSAKGGSLAAFGSGASGYSTAQGLLSELPASELSSFVTLSTSLPASALTVNSLVGVLTNGGNGSVFLVTANSGGSITLEFSTYGSGVASTGPTITNVLNNYSYIPSSGFVNSGVSPSTIAYVSGTNMSAPPSGTLTLNSSAAPGLPTTSAGATFNITAGGKTYPAPIYYASPTQAAIVIPAAVPVGTATIVVNYNNANSNSYSFQVVAAAVGLDTYYGTGTGLITATNATTGALYNYLNSVPPGQIVVFWGSGSGADSQDSDTVFASAPHSVNQSNTQFWIGNQQATVFYAGSSGYPGVMQYNVQIPANSATGCGVSVVAVVDGTPSNFGTLPIGQGVCQDPTLGYNGTTLTTEVTQTNYSSGSVILFQSTTPATSGAGTTTTQLGIGNFEQYTGSATVSSAGFLSLGSCIVSEVAVTGTSTITTTGLNAGTLTVTGPGGSATLVSEASLFPTGGSSLAGAYATINASGTSTLPAGFITPGGTYTFQASGGTTTPSVGPFTTQIVFSNPLFQWTNQAAASTVTRSAGQQVTWTGGSPGTYVYMSGSSSNGTISGSFTCYAPQSALSFTIPGFVLDTLPASNTGGTLSVANSTVPVSFTATGLTYGDAIGEVSYQINAIYK